MNVLGVDLGQRHTGLAFLDTSVGIVMPLTVIHHASNDELIASLADVINERDIGHVVFGLPLLPSGEEGSQARIVRDTVDELHLPPSVTRSLVDERYTNDNRPSSSDHTDAACAILTVYQDRAKYG